MKSTGNIFITLVLCCSFMLSGYQRRAIDVKIGTEELKLYQLIMDYRKANNLATIPLSKSLTYVAQQHCLDLVNNRPDSGICNMHSWSARGSWTACCYTPDHLQATCMWKKPAELTTYTGDGFEIACTSGMGNGLAEMTAAKGLESWKKSEGHNNVILNKSVWKDMKWNAIGIGIYKGYAMVWFGQAADAEGEPAR